MPNPAGQTCLFLEYISETANYPPAPDGITIYAIGDIHGRLDLLKNVHQQIDQDKNLRKPKQFVEVYLGDYIDRGPDSAGVVSHLIARGRDAHTIFLRGNHEQYLLDFLQGAECWEQWKDIGAIPSVLSYGLAPALLSRDTAQEGIRRALAQRLPQEHARFYGATEPYLEAGPHLSCTPACGQGSSCSTRRSGTFWVSAGNFSTTKAILDASSCTATRPCRKRICGPIGSISTRARSLLTC